MAGFVLFSCKLDQQTTDSSSADSDGLHLVASGGKLHSNTTADLQAAVVKRLCKTQTPSVISISRSSAPSQVEADEPRVSVTCFMHVLPGADVSSLEVRAPGHDTLIVCYLLTTEGELEGLLDLYLSDLSSHALALTEILARPLPDLGGQVRRHLDTWYSDAVRYLYRVVAGHSERDLALLLYLALTSTTYSFGNVSSDSDKQLVSDLTKFISCCNVLEMLCLPADGELDSGTAKPPPSLVAGDGSGQTGRHEALHLSIQDGKLLVPSEWQSSKTQNSYCVKWGQYLKEQVTGVADGGDGSSVDFFPDADSSTTDFMLRQVVDTMKLKTIQALNRFKRLVKQGEGDYYALYRAFLFLKQSGNKDILIPLMTFEIDNGSGEKVPQNTKDVITVLEDFMRQVQ